MAFVTKIQKQRKSNRAITHPNIESAAGNSLNSPQPSIPVIHAKLKIGTPNDKYEKQADSVADSVVAAPVNEVQAVPKEEGMQMMPEEKESMRMMPDEDENVQMMPEEEGNVQMMPEEKDNVQMMPEEEDSVQMEMEDETVQPKPDIQKKPDGTSQASPALANKLASIKGGGQSLPKDVQREMDSKIGADFSEVKIHNNNQSTEMNNAIGAKAFTHGNNIYFNDGEYSTSSQSGKHLLAHELTHTVQQGAVLSNSVQRRFDPEDAVTEMIGKKFKSNTGFSISGGAIHFPMGQVLKVTAWTNSSTQITATAFHGASRTTHTINVPKSWLKTIPNTTSGLHQYAAGVDSQVKSVKKGETAIASHKAKRPDYVKFKNIPGYDVELARLEGLQAVRNRSLNRKLIQETMYNSLDASVKKWTDYYNKNIGAGKKWPKLDANIVKSMMYQESEIGTSGAHLLASPRFTGDPKTRFNVMQAVDSSGEQQLLMMNEMDPALVARYKSNDVRPDLYKAQKRRPILLAKDTAGTLAGSETAELAELNRRSSNGRSWDYYFWTDLRFYNAFKDFNAQTAPTRNLNYDYWIRTGVRWLFHKRRGVSSWAEAIRAYNGTGQKARDYKKHVIARRDRAKGASKPIIPTRTN